jgi:cellulase (glycosyl hydrolase family 5)
MKFLSFGVLISISVGCASQNETGANMTNADSPATAQAGRLSLQGEHILAPNGAEIKLRGWNWGQWNTVLAGDLASKGYPNADPDDPSDGGDAVNQGANVVRILLRWWGKWGDNVDRFGLPVDSRDENGVAHVSAQALALLDDEISEATKHGLWVVLAVDSNCGQESPDDDDPSKTYCNDTVHGVDHANFVNDPAMKAELMEIWAHLADTYKSHPRIAMYEILPEPQFGCTLPKNCNYDAVTAFYTDLIATVRSKDAATPILVGPGSGYAMKHIDTAFIPDPDGTKKLIYTADMLSGEAMSMADLGAFTSFRSAHNVPVFVQQVGINQSDVTDKNGNLDSKAYTADVMAVLQQLDDDDIGWTWWTYREQNSGGDGYAPWSLSSAPDTWQAAATPGMLATISSYFTR